MHTYEPYLWHTVSNTVFINPDIYIRFQTCGISKKKMEKSGLPSEASAIFGLSRKIKSGIFGRRGKDKFSFHL